jgi:hypothetical protein
MECKNNISIITGKKKLERLRLTHGIQKKEIKTQHEISPHNFSMTVGRYRFLSKEWNKLTYEFTFMKLHS